MKNGLNYKNIILFLLLFVFAGCISPSGNPSSTCLKKFSKKWLKANSQERYQLINDNNLNLLQKQLKGKDEKLVLQVLGKPDVSTLENKGKIYKEYKNEKYRFKYDLDDIFSFYTLEIVFETNNRVLCVKIYD